MSAKREDHLEFFVRQLIEVLGGEEAHRGFLKIERVAREFQIRRRFNGVGRDVDGGQHQATDRRRESLTETVRFKTVQAD